MNTLRADELSADVRAASDLLYRFHGKLQSIQGEHGYFSAERRENFLGRTAIVLTEGGFGDDGGYEGYNSQIQLNYSRGGELRSVRSRDEFEPVGPLIVPRGMTNTNRWGLSKFFS